MKQKILLLLLSMSMIVIGGCWSRRELMELAIVVGIGIDKKENEYVVSSQVVIPSEAGGQKASPIGYAPTTKFVASAPTIIEAFRKMTTISPRRMYTSHVRILVIGEEVAEEGLQDVLDYFYRDRTFRLDFYVVIARKTKAENILSIFTKLEKIPSVSLFTSLATSEKTYSNARGVHLDELINTMVSPGKNPVLTGLTIIGDETQGETKDNIQRITPHTRLKISTLGVLKKDKLVGWLSDKESRGFNFITGQVMGSVGDVVLPSGGKVAVEAFRSEAHMKSRIRRGEPEMEIKILTEGDIAEVDGSIDLMEQKNIQMLENLLEQRIKHLAESAIEKGQTKLKSDIFGFGEVIHRQHPKIWNKLQKNWAEDFVDVPVRIKVDAKLRRTGKVLDSFIEELNKK
ncbi:Ger(x)C family spore germination protein [Cohnella luojiensis]|uniref:Ger(X)C family spore germination protein n=1 Tax=Cohnella luojiensis TaxID=652876 RepID=A0A4Y8LQ43_9BACL|nr:Ger(x)C family spore germination protein [Cohnella luojiensis]TFE23461.1 Ger(x)C family spore germination protein [Cohnella luojiensis]